MNHNLDEIAADYPQNEGQEQAECLPEKDLVLGNLVIMTESKYIFSHGSMFILMLQHCTSICESWCESEFWFSANVGVLDAPLLPSLLCILRVIRFCSSLSSLSTMVT